MDYLITVIIFNSTIIIGCPKFVTRDEWGARPPRSPPTSIGNNVSIQSVYSINDYNSILISLGAIPICPPLY